MSPAILIMTLLAGLAGWVAGTAAGTSVRPWFVALVAALVALEVSTVRPAIESVSDRGMSRAATRFWRRTELVALVLGVKALHVVTALPEALQELGGFPRGFVDPETVTGWLVGLAVWALVNGTIDDLEAIEQGVEEGRGSVARIRLRVTGTSVIVMGTAAFGAIGVPGLLDLDRGASSRVPVAGVLYVVTALLALSRLALRASLGRWTRDGARVDPDVADRWRRAAAVVVGAAVLVGVAVPLVTRSATAVPLAAVTRAGGIGDWLVRTVEGIGEIEPPDRDRGQGEQSVPPELDPIPDPTTPTWFGELVMWLFVGMIFAWVILRAGRARVRRELPEGESPEWSRVLVEAVKVLWAALAALVRAIAGVFRDAGAVVAGRLRRRPPPPPAAPAGPAPPPLPDDPVRARIYLAHRRFVRAAGSRFGMRRPPETAREFAGRVRSIAPPEIDVLTWAYEAARYSDHRLSVTDAGRAETAADEVVGLLEEGPPEVGPGPG